MKQTFHLSLIVVALVLLCSIDEKSSAMILPIEDAEASEDRHGLPERERLRYLTLLNQIISQKNDKQYEKSLSICNSALNNYPNNPELLQLRCSIHKELNQYSNGLADINHAISLRPRRETLVYDRAEIEFLQKDFDHTLIDCDTAITLGTRRSVQAYALKARTYKALGKTQEAMKTARDCIYHASVIGSPENGSSFMGNEFGELAVPERRFNQNDEQTIYDAIDRLASSKSMPSDSEIQQVLSNEHSTQLPLWQRHYRDAAGSEVLTILPNVDRCTILSEDLERRYGNSIVSVNPGIGMCPHWYKRYALTKENCRVYFAFSMRGVNYLECITIWWK